jgi:hypothetical protein
LIIGILKPSILSWLQQFCNLNLMNIYKLTNPNNYYGSYVSCVVAANSEEEARFIYPDEPDYCKYRWNGISWEYKLNNEDHWNEAGHWAPPNRLIGVADPSITNPQVIESYFLQ